MSFQWWWTTPRGWSKSERKGSECWSPGWKLEANLCFVCIITLNTNPCLSVVLLSWKQNPPFSRAAAPGNDGGQILCSSICCYTLEPPAASVKALTFQISVLHKCKWSQRKNSCVCCKNLVTAATRGGAGWANGGSFSILDLISVCVLIQICYFLKK